MNRYCHPEDKTPSSAHAARSPSATLQKRTDLEAYRGEKILESSGRKYREFHSRKFPDRGARAAGAAHETVPRRKGRHSPNQVSWKRVKIVLQRRENPTRAAKVTRRCDR